MDKGNSVGTQGLLFIVFFSSKSASYTQRVMWMHVQKAVNTPGARKQYVLLLLFITVGYQSIQLLTIILLYLVCRKYVYFLIGYINSSRF